MMGGDWGWKEDDELVSFDGAFVFCLSAVAREDFFVGRKEDWMID